MKRVFTLLLMLALVPAIASAAIPNELTNLNAENVVFQGRMGNGSCRLHVTGTHNGQPYSASYYLTGAMEYYTYTFDCGCEVDFNSAGGIYNDAPVRNNIPQHGGTHEWDESTQSWIKYSYNYDPETDTETVTIKNIVTAEELGHAYSASTHAAPVTFGGVDGKRPPLNAADAVAAYGTYAELKNAALTTFAAKLAEETGEQIPDSRVSGSNAAFVKKNGMYAYYYNGELFEVYVGSVVFNTYWDDGSTCRVYGDSAYGINTIGHYDWETGDLFEYQFYTADRSMNAVYTVKNVLASYEVWDSSRGYWGFFDNEWYYNASGDAFNTTKATPPAEVLEKILRAPAPAEYESACVTDVSQLTDDQKGVPFILADKSAIGGASVQTESKQLEDGHTTEFDISLMKGSAEVEPSEPVTLTLGYPAGMPQDISKDYEFVVRHKTASGEYEYMTTMNGAVTLTANGPQVTATSFSPYEVIWGTAADLAWAKDYPAPDSAPNPGTTAGNTASLPQTGDDSQLLFFAALLAISGCALVLISKRRAHQ